MAPKKAQKMSLNAFLEDKALGSWADEMEALPTAPAPRTDDGGYNDRGYGRKDDFMSSRPDRPSFTPREEVPIPTNPPFNAFVGNLSFDVEESHLESYFEHADGIKSVKIIRDGEKSKGFGYVEFNTVEGLKDGLKKHGIQFMGRDIRVNVAEPPKERGGRFGHGDDDKFSGTWRRDGPLPEAPGRDGGSRRRYEGLGASDSNRGDSVSEGNANWRSNRPPPRAVPEVDLPPRRRGSGFSTPSHEGEMSPADTEDKWTIGSKFRASAPAGENQSGSRFGSVRGRGDMGPPSTPSIAEESDWRKPRPGRTSSSPTNSVPPTPQMGRKKLELLPRTGSSQPTPLSSPKSASFSSTASKPNPFGAAKPVDVTARDAAIQERLEKDKAERSQHSMSRTNSRQPRQRPSADAPAKETNEARSPTSPKSTDNAPNPTRAPVPSATVRPSFSFANAAAGKVPGPLPTDDDTEDAQADTEDASGVDAVTKDISEVVI